MKIEESYSAWAVELQHPRSRSILVESVGRTRKESRENFSNAWGDYATRALEAGTARFVKVTISCEPSP